MFFDITIDFSISKNFFSSIPVFLYFSVEKASSANLQTPLPLPELPHRFPNPLIFCLYSMARYDKVAYEDNQQIYFI